MRVTPAMVGRQVRFMARSAVYIARHPASGRELPRLVRTRGRGTMHLRLPWLPFRVIDRLEQAVGPGSRVFEYGGGGSTLWFLDRGAEVVTVEHHEGWAAALRDRIRSEHWVLHAIPDDGPHPEAYESYVASIGEYPDDHFDVVVVDGRSRAACVRAAAPKVRPGGLLVVDDVDRERYAAAMDEVDWPREDVVGFAPAKPSLAFTGVLRRPDAVGA